MRLDAATARVVSTVSVVATLLTGFGLVAAGLPATAAASRVLAVISAALAFLAVLCALTAQILTVTRGLNGNNLKDVERWYRRRFETRAPLAAAASILLVLAAATAGAAAVLTLTRTSPEVPTLAVTRTLELSAPNTTTSSAAARPAPVAMSTLVVDVAFRGLAPSQVASVTVTLDGQVAAEARSPQGQTARLPGHSRSSMCLAAGSQSSTLASRPPSAPPGLSQARPFR